MTVGTNALLEGTGARTSLVATEGFGDLLELRRQTRAHLYRLDAHHPPPLVPHERTHEVRERRGPDGVLEPLDEASLARVVEAVRADGSEAVAVGLLFSFAHPAHERRVAEALRAALPGVHVSASCEVLPEIREYERLSTTAVDAYLTPVLRAYLERLAGRAAEAGLPAPAIMQSSGGVLPIEACRDHAAWTVLSGPAGGVVGAARVAAREDRPLALTFDMGGTSCDVALVRDGVPARGGGDGDRRAPAAPPDARRGDGLRGRREHRLGRLRRRAARGPALGRGAAGPGGLRPRRRPADGHRRRRRPRAAPHGPPARRRSGSTPARRARRWPASPPSSAWRWRRAPRAS